MAVLGLFSPLISLDTRCIITLWLKNQNAYQFWREKVSPDTLDAAWNYIP